MSLGILMVNTLLFKRGNADFYVNIMAATAFFSHHPKLSGLSFPVLSLVALYVLTGCDYVSSFYRCSITLFLETLLQDTSFICPMASY